MKIKKCANLIGQTVSFGPGVSAAVQNGFAQSGVLKATHPETRSVSIEVTNSSGVTETINVLAAQVIDLKENYDFVMRTRKAAYEKILAEEAAQAAAAKPKVPGQVARGRARADGFSASVQQLRLSINGILALCEQPNVRRLLESREVQKMLSAFDNAESPVNIVRSASDIVKLLVIISAITAPTQVGDGLANAITHQLASCSALLPDQGDSTPAAAPTDAAAQDDQVVGVPMVQPQASEDPSIENRPYEIVGV